MYFKKNIFNNQIIEYIMRVLGFCIFAKFIPLMYLGSIFILISWLVSNITYLIINFFYIIFMHRTIDSDNIALFAILYTILFGYYFIAKIFGIFKKLDKMNFLISFIIVVLIFILHICIQKSNILVFERINKDLYLDFEAYFLIPAFLLYKFLNFLTQIFPVPFKKIGYIFSIDLIKDIYNYVKRRYTRKLFKKVK